MTHCSKKVTRWRFGLRSQVAEHTGARVVTGSEAFSETRQYGLSHADLARILPRFLPGVIPTCDGTRYHFALSNLQSVSISLGPEQERRLGGIRILFVELTFEFVGLDAVQRHDFQVRFDRSFQKGGG